MRRWAVIGLLCVISGTVGCVQLPNRGLFVRRTPPAITDENRGDEPSKSLLNQRDRDRDPQAEEPDALSRAESSGESSELTGGLFDVSNRAVSDDSFAAIEAPAPKRHSAAAPAPFSPPANVRELQPSSDASQPDVVTPASANINDPRSGVVSADYETASRSNSSGIEQAGGQRRATDSATAPNPWDRFRGLSPNWDPATDANRGSQDRHAIGRSVEPQQPFVPNQALNSPTNVPPPVYRQEFSQNNAFNGGPTSVAPMNTANTPEPWPRAPGATGFNAATQPFDPSFRVQWVNAEQGTNAAAIPGVNSSPAFNAPNFTPVANLPPTFGLSAGAPALTPFLSSPELERLITQTTVEAAAMTPGDNEISRQLYLRKHVQLRLLHLIAGQMDRALQPVPGVDPIDQEFWQQMLWGMANYFDTQGMPDSAERATQTIAQLQAAASRLQEKARLELHNVSFCHKISGFGNYQRFKPDVFTPGQPVLLYAEVANFKSEVTADGQFRTLMKSTLDVLEAGPAGRVIETLPLAPAEDRCRNQRRDYYHSYEFAVPQACNPGPHTLRLRVEDQIGKKITVSMLNFTVQ